MSPRGGSLLKTLCLCRKWSLWYFWCRVWGGHVGFLRGVGRWARSVLTQITVQTFAPASEVYSLSLSTPKTILQLVLSMPMLLALPGMQSPPVFCYLNTSLSSRGFETQWFKALDLISSGNGHIRVNLWVSWGPNFFLHKMGIIIGAT